ncbi:Gfo/Idh/MocA family oxidoreductase [Pseudokineococcus basanitobsidens]|uniref:Gfo/Idh/MocA family oxidoreductase n=1 Tax=Pseudokineococcus basanitobsidens TaxID=1926649 RepID=A0ABU8RGS0_9ACTN
MRIGLVGLGRIGSFHAQTLVGLPAVTRLVVTDVVPAAARAAVDRLGDGRVETAASPEALLAADLDGVVVAAATDAHPALLHAALDAGLPVFCEKPVAREAGDALAVLRHARETGVPVQIGYNRRFDVAVAAARAAVVSGELGELHTVRSTTLDPAPPPPAYVRTSGGIFADCTVHDLDTIRFVTGREVVEVYATGRAHGDPVFAETGDVATAASVLTLDDGTLALVSSARYNARGYDCRLELHGTRDSVAVGLEDRLPLRSLEPGTTFPAGTPHDFFMDRFTQAYRTELAAFTEVVAGTRPSPCTVEDALEVAWVAQALALSVAEHRPVRVDEVRVDEVRVDEVRVDEVRVDRGDDGGSPEPG